MAQSRQKLTRAVATCILYQMSRYAILLMCASGSAFGQIPADPTEDNLTYRLEYETRDADAHYDCRSRRGDRYAADFQKRFGKRIQHLKAVHVARSGPDPNFMILSSCRVFTGSSVERDVRHRRAMNDFEDNLRKLEREFGGY